MADSPTAAQSVLNLPELLEQILLDLHPCHLFTAQRVNKTWRAVIQSSKALRRAMSLEPFSASAYGKKGDSTNIQLMNHWWENLYLISDKAVQWTTRPFRLHFWATRDQVQDRLHIHLNVRVNTNAKTEKDPRPIKRRDPSLLGQLLDDFPFQNKGSWRDVMIGIEDTEVDVYLSTETSGRLVSYRLCEVSTLGGLVDSIKTVLLECLSDPQ